MKFCSLYSGSTGNSLFVQGNETKILVDAGVSAKKVVEGLSSIDVDINDINAIIVTHEHIDHIRCYLIKIGLHLSFLHTSFMIFLQCFFGEGGMFVYVCNVF